MEICCMTQGAQTEALWQSRKMGWGGRWKGGFGGWGHGVRMANSCWCMTKKTQDSVKQISFN